MILDKHAINVKSSAPRHHCCITVIISNVGRDDKMLIFRQCGGQKPSHNICIISARERFLPCRTSWARLLFWQLFQQWMERTIFSQQILSIASEGQSLLSSVKWKPWIHTSFFVLFFWAEGEQELLKVCPVGKTGSSEGRHSQFPKAESYLLHATTLSQLLACQSRHRV